jgi:hypothetical protein
VENLQAGHHEDHESTREDEDLLLELCEPTGEVEDAPQSWIDAYTDEQEDPAAAPTDEGVNVYGVQQLLRKMSIILNRR